MANQLGVGKLGAVVAVVVAYAMAVGTAQAKPTATATAVDAPRAGSGVYKSTMSDGTVVFSDRLLANTSGVSVMQYGGGSDATEIARKERDYWRQRSDAFAERQLARDRELEATRRASIAAEKRASEMQVVIITAGGTNVVQSHRAHKQTDNIAIRGVYETSPGAVNGRFSTPLPGIGSAAKFR